MAMMTKKLKIGALSFVNSLPYFSDLERILKEAFGSDGSSDMPFEITFGTPREINTLLEQGSIDVGLVSSASYLDNRPEYILLSPFGIACQDEVLSVRLYYKGKLEDLHQQELFVPWYSATSTALLHILCKNLWQIQPHFVESSTNPKILSDSAKAFLSIGDDCLKMEFIPDFSYIDLGRSWREWTETPFIFALIATRVDALKEKRPLLKIFFKCLEKHLSEFEKNQDAVITRASDKMNCSQHLIRHYYRLIDYRLNEEHFAGLERYSQLR